MFRLVPFLIGEAGLPSGTVTLSALWGIVTLASLGELPRLAPGFSPWHAVVAVACAPSASLVVP
eukprot:SAG11_NODE_26_length_23420_cov_40.459886_2_plen_64_part_00